VKKLLLSLSVLFSFAAYSFYVKNTSQEAAVLPNVPSQTQNNTSPNNILDASPNIKISKGYNNGEYTGKVADAYYGNIQVKAIIKNNQITDVQFLQYPNDRGHSIEINTYAMPILTQEAVQSQNAKVDIVSGATDSSKAFIESLTSALNQAK
jgi:uncharacterized protein with FMN-binding domain